MSTSEPATNPYQSATNENPLGEHRGIDQETVESWRSLGGWQTFFSCLGFFGSFCGIAFVLFVVIFGVGVDRGRSFGVESVVSLVVFLPIVISVYLIPSVLLFKSGRLARNFASGESGSLVEVVQSQRIFWRYVGVLAIIMIAFYAVAFVATILGAFRS